MKNKSILCSLIIFSVFLAVGNPAFAAPDEFICAAAEAAACVLDEPCTRGSAEKFNLPLIWKVDLKEKSIVSLRESGEERTSKILEVLEKENALVLMGVEESAAWTVIIDTSGGKMTMTSATLNEGYVVHGACSSKILK